MTSIVAFDTPITYVVGNSKVLYSRNESVLDRFHVLKEGLNTFTKAGPSESLLHKAYEYLNDAYVNLYNINLGTSDLLDRRIEATKIIGKLAQCVGYANANYYPDGIRKGVRQSYDLAYLPNDYKNLVKAAINSSSKEELTSNIEKLLLNTRVFLKEQQIGFSEHETYDLMIGYYEEWKRVVWQTEVATLEDNQEELFMIVGYFLEEIALFLTAIEEGVWYNDRNVFNEYKKSIESLLEQDLFELVKDKNYVTLMDSIRSFEQKFVMRLENNGVQIAKYNTVEEFEKALSEK